MNVNIADIKHINLDEVPEYKNADYRIEILSNNGIEIATMFLREYELKELARILNEFVGEL